MSVSQTKEYQMSKTTLIVVVVVVVGCGTNSSSICTICSSIYGCCCDTSIISVLSVVIYQKHNFNMQQEGFLIFQFSSTTI
jgi:hypothetical protein